jgi:hypothetical protein
MFKKVSWILVLLLLLSLPAMACGLFGGDEEEATAVPTIEEPAVEEEAAPAPTEEPAAAEETAPEAETDTTTEEETAVEETDVEEPATDAEAAPALSASALELSTIEELPFNSYRVAMMLEFSGVKADGQEVTQSLNGDFAFTTEPPANSMTISFSGIEEDLGADSIEMAQIEGTTYMVVPEMGCITSQVEDLSENPFADMIAPDEFLSDLEGAQYEGEETINNIRTLHYSFDKTALLTAQMSADEIDEAEGHVYIAKDGGFLVRMVVDATGKIDFFDEGVDQNGDLHIEINLTDVDEPIEIVIPAACEATAAGGGSEFPMLDDATEVSSFAGVMSYKTAVSTEEALAFYDDALAAEGWEKDEGSSFVGGGSALVSYTRDGETLSLTISPDEESGGTYIILLSETE